MFDYKPVKNGGMTQVKDSQVNEEAISNLLQIARNRPFEWAKRKYIPTNRGVKEPLNFLAQLLLFCNREEVSAVFLSTTICMGIKWGI